MPSHVVHACSESRRKRFSDTWWQNAKLYLNSCKAYQNMMHNYVYLCSEVAHLQAVYYDIYYTDTQAWGVL